MEPGYCSVCLEHVASRFHFPAHALICAGGGKKRVVREPAEEEILKMILEDRVDDVQALLENDAVPRALVSIQYARSVEMCHLLLQYGADLYEYVGNGQVALEVAGRYFNFREFLPRGEPPIRPYVAQLVALRDLHHTTLDEKFVIIERWPVHRWPTEPDLDEDDAVTYYVPSVSVSAHEHVSFYREMIWNGFFPVHASAEKFVEDVYFERYNTETLNFWHGEDMWRFATEFSRWKTGSLALFMREASRSPVSFPLLIFGQHSMIYKSSARAKTDMSLFRNLEANIIRALTNGMISVTRYSKSVDVGLYHDVHDFEGVCGTFYYWESESHVFLKVGQVLRASDKLEALIKLGRKRWGGDFASRVIRRIAEDRSITLEFTPQQFKNFVTSLKYDRRTDDERVHRVLSSPITENVQQDRVFFAGKILGVYAHQDKLDQKLCRAARKQGYDAVILERMVGSRQLVTEVLDTRPREESIRNLHFLEN